MVKRASSRLTNGFSENHSKNCLQFRISKQGGCAMNCLCKLLLWSCLPGHRFCRRIVIGFLRNRRRLPDRAGSHACDRDSVDDGDRHVARGRRSVRGGNCRELWRLRNDQLADCQPVRSRRPGWRHSRRCVRKSARSKEAGTQFDVRWPGYSGRPLRRRARNGDAVRGLNISYSLERTVAW